MKNSLDHLPKHKQRELASIVDTIKQAGVRAQLIMLFGSHARGDWVHDVRTDKKGNTISYISDYDILILVKKN